MVTRIRIHRRGIPPRDAWHGPPEPVQRIRDVKAWSWTWQRDAACRNLGSWLFFAPDGERSSARRQREAAAKEVCRSCPVQAPCALYALATRQRYGVWGGLTEDDRRQPVADQRQHTWAPRGRPARDQR
jgi:WhiB family transcriptional regulator, redox-sensing transcriptional regulator